MNRMLLHALALGVALVVPVVAQQTAVPTALLKAQEYQPASALAPHITIDSIFGSCTVTEPILIELLAHPVMERLKEIDQHGPPTYFDNQPTFSRYDHCVGVFHLLRIHNRPLTEQIAGLLHDASHTVFSHVADYLFKTGNQHSYQDMIHEWYLEKMGLGALLERYNLTIADINPDNPAFEALEQKHPRLCADRIQYILHTGLVFNKITKAELNALVKDLTFKNHAWQFSSEENAQRLAELSAYFTEHFFATPENLVWRHWLCSALKQTIALGLLSSDDIHFSTDTAVLETLHTCKDPHVQKMLEKCKNAQRHFRTCREDEEHDLIDYAKVRAVDPLVQTTKEDEPKPLTQRCPQYRNALHVLKQKLAPGTRVKLYADCNA